METKSLPTEGISAENTEILSSDVAIENDEMQISEDVGTLWTAGAGRGEHRLAHTVIVLSIIGMAVAVPFAGIPLTQIPGFIPGHEAALIATDLVTALLLFGQFSQVRALSLLMLACGYLFDALIIVPHAISYPGIFLTGGLPGSQTTAWLYMFWHGGFPLWVIAYAVFRTRETRRLAVDNMINMPTAIATISSIIAVTVLTIGLTFLAIHSGPVLPQIMDGHVVKTKLIAWIAWGITIVAIICLCRKPSRSTLDLWLMVVMVSWLLDITLSAIFISSRFELGFYAGRAYGLVAATFVLGMLIIDTSRLYAKLAEITTKLAGYARQLDIRVRQRTIELTQSNQQLGAVLEAAPVAIYMVDAEGIVTMWTVSAERIFGYSAAEAIGKFPPHILEQDADAFRAKLCQKIKSNLIFPVETRARRHDEGMIDIAQRGAVVNDKTGQFYGIMFIAADITGSRKVENQLRQSQKMEAIGNLTGGMAHDFNNLLGIVIGNLDLLKDLRSEDPDVQEFASEALEAAVRGADLTKRLLAFARRQPLSPERADVNSLVTNITTLLKRTLGEDIEFILELGENIWPIIIDPVQLESSLANLANNARDAMPNGGRLIISTHNRELDEDYTSQYVDLRPGYYALIEVSDTGTGMAPEVASRIFEPFYTTKEEGKGTGLGLAMVFGFMKQSGGHLNVYSEAGVGTTFRLYLPRATIKEDAVALAAKAKPNRGRGERVLVVEDNPGLRRVVVRQLQELGYEVIEAEHAQMAIDILEVERADLLLTDIVMPGTISGYDLARLVRTHWPNMKVVLTSGFPERLVNTEGLSNVRLLSKPYRRDDLARLISEVLATPIANGHLF